MKTPNRNTIMSRNPNSYSRELVVNDRDVAVVVQNQMRSKYGISYDFDFPPRTLPKQEWFNENWSHVHGYQFSKSNKPDVFYFAKAEDHKNMVKILEEVRNGKSVFDFV
jgi:hypothetical protein